MTPPPLYKTPGAASFCSTVAIMLLVVGTLICAFGFFGIADNTPSGAATFGLGCETLVASAPLFALAAIIDQLARIRYAVDSGFARLHGETPPPSPDALDAALAAMPRI